MLISSSEFTFKRLIKYGFSNLLRLTFCYNNFGSKLLYFFTKNIMKWVTELSFSKSLFSILVYSFYSNLELMLILSTSWLDNDSINFYSNSPR